MLLRVSSLAPGSGEDDADGLALTFGAEDAVDGLPRNEHLD